MLRIALKCHAACVEHARTHNLRDGSPMGKSKRPPEGERIAPMFLMPIAGATYRAGPSRAVPALHLRPPTERDGR